MRSTDFRKVFGAFWVVILGLGAETLSESRFFYARPAQISFKSFVKIMDFLAGEGSILDEIVAEQIC